jgi:hypothetical protein
VTILRRIIGIAVASGLTLAVGELSYTTVPVGTSDSAMVRLAWRATPARIRHCRTLTPEELARIPAHMRRTEECSETTLPYRLTVRLDSNPPFVLPVHAAGARQDRPMYVFQEWRVLPGPRMIRIRFEREPVPEGATEPLSDTPALLVLDTTTVISARQIALIGYDADSRRLVLQPGRAP